MDSPSQTAIIANAARLLKDAKLLVDHERYASAFALSVLALEEIGKVVLDLWGKPEAPPKVNKLNKRPSAHVKKQAAVSSLLLAESVAKELGEVITSGGTDDDMLVEHVVRFMHESESGRFHWLVGIGAVDKTKQVALYQDDLYAEAGLSAEGFDGDDLQKLFSRCRLAVAAVSDQRVMRVGKAIYGVYLQR